MYNCTLSWKEKSSVSEMNWKWRVLFELIICVTFKSLSRFGLNNVYSHFWYHTVGRFQELQVSYPIKLSDRNKHVRSYRHTILCIPWPYITKTRSAHSTNTSGRYLLTRITNREILLQLSVVLIGSDALAIMTISMTMELMDSVPKDQDPFSIGLN